MLRRFYKSLFIGRRWYWLFVSVILLFILSYGISLLFIIAQLLLLFAVVTSMLDYLIQNYLLPYYPDAKIGQPFELNHRIERVDVLCQPQ